MLERLTSIITCIPACDLQTISYDNEVIRAAGGEVITQFDYFTVDTTYGECLEIHQQDSRYSQLYDLFSARLTNIELDKSCRVVLYPAAD